MIVEVNYTKEVNCCRECPYYFQEHDMGATIPICTKEYKILSSSSIISNECPLDLSKSNVLEELKPSSHIGNLKPIKCNCSDETIDVDKAIEILKIVKNCWADQIPNDGKKIADADAIEQSIHCLEEYKESEERIKQASHH